MDFMVEEKNRDELAKYFKEIREKRKIGLNQLALKAGVQKTILSRLENSKILKINPFFLKQLSKALNIDYKELYKIVGYLEEEDFDENKKLVSTCNQIKKELCGEFSNLSDEEKGKVLIFIKEFIKK